MLFYYIVRVSYDVKVENGKTATNVTIHNQREIDHQQMGHFFHEVIIHKWLLPATRYLISMGNFVGG